RVRFAGASGAHAALLRSDQQLRHEVIAQAVALNPERLWIEKVNTDTQPLQLAQAPASGAAANAFAELQDLARTAPQDESFAQALQASWQAVLEKLPHEVLAQAPELAALRQQPEEALAAQLQDALTLLGARTGAAADADR
ncbi:MAG: DNA repair exonuclease, partial [Alicycliphilus sp.]|nr:DNA repair exonuclease [Alicycliphilus sp.]